MNIFSRLKYLVSKKIIDIPTFLFPNMQYLVITGSEAYGMASSNSDLDLLGVSIEPHSSIFPSQNNIIVGYDSFDQFTTWTSHSIKDPDKKVTYDLNFYGLIKFFSLLVDSNPNICETLFVDHTHVLSISPLFNIVREKRSLFLTKRFAYKSRMYAFAQMKRMDRDIDKDGKRYAMIEKYGYDVKAGSHTIRLLSLSEDILRGEDINLRKHSDHMSAVRNGNISKKDLLEWATEQEKKLIKLEAESKIPDKPNKELVRQLLINIINKHYADKEQSFTSENTDKQLIAQIKDLIKGY